MTGKRHILQYLVFCISMMTGYAYGQTSHTSTSAESKVLTLEKDFVALVDQPVSGIITQGFGSHPLPIEEIRFMRRKSSGQNLHVLLLCVESCAADTNMAAGLIVIPDEEWRPLRFRIATIYDPSQIRTTAQLQSQGKQLILVLSFATDEGWWHARQALKRAGLTAMLDPTADARTEFLGFSVARGVLPLRDAQVLFK